MSKADVFAAVDDESERLCDLAAAIWADPEVALQETESSRRLQEALAVEGFDVEAGVAGMETAFVARYGDEAPVVGTMGEFDALPGMSQAAVAERRPIEEGTPGHGCGHNLFGVGSLAGAIATKRAIERGGLTGSIVYYGTPAEEVGIGKVAMVRNGVFDSTDALVSWHPGWFNAPARGSCLAIDSFEFTFEGESSHAAAAPDAGRSALDAVQLLNTGVEYMREHIPDAARIHYVISEGGGAANVVPPTATVEYIIRAPERPAVERLADWVQDCAEGAALMTQTELTARKTGGAYGVLPNDTIADRIRANMDAAEFRLTDEQASFAADLRATLDEDAIGNALDELPESAQNEARGTPMFTRPIDAPDSGEVGSYSTDSGDVSWTVPLGRFRAATWPVGTPPHSWQAVAAGKNLGTAGMLFAGKVIGATLYDLLEDQARLATATEEFAERTAGHEYVSPLPADADPQALVTR